MPLTTNWEEVKLLKYVDLVKSGVKKFRGLKKYISTGSLETGEITDFVEVDYESRPSRANMEVKANDILFAKMKDTEKVFVVSEEDAENLYSTGFAILRIINFDKISPKYAYYWLRSPYFQNEKNRECTGATQKAINKSKLRRFSIPLPNIEQQRKIISILEKVDKLIKWREESDKLTNHYINTVFLKMFGDPFRNQKKWQTIKLEKLASVIVDCPHSTPNYEKMITEYPCIRTTELRNGYIDWSSMKYVNEETYLQRTKRLTPKEDDIVYGREGSFGEAVRVPKDIRLCLGQRVMLFRPDCSICNSIFLWALLRSKGIYIQAINNVKGATVGHVDVRSIKKFKAFCPPLNLQNNFASLVTKTEIAKEHIKQSEQYIHDLFSALMQRVFSGEFDC